MAQLIFLRHNNTLQGTSGERDFPGFKLAIKLIKVQYCKSRICEKIMY